LPTEPRDGDWLASVAADAASHAGAPIELLGDYLPLLADAAASRRLPREQELAAVATLGRSAAEQGVPAARAVDLYLSAAWRLWRRLPDEVRSGDSEQVRAAAEAVLQVVDGAVAALVGGYEAAGRQRIRREEEARRELVDDLLRGDSDLAGLIERGEPFGLDLGRAHRVALAAPARRLPDTETAVSALERLILDRFGDRGVLVATKDGLLVVLTPTVAAARGRHAPDAELAQLVHSELSRLPTGGPWQVAEGRPYPGAYGVARSYEEAREALALVQRLGMDQPVVHARDLLIYRVLARDEAAILDLVEQVLTPLTHARGGAEPWLETLEVYFAAGNVATAAARRLHLSVRAVTYRLARVRTMTGYDPADPIQRFTLYAAVLGARLLNWPARRPSGATADRN
jgi:sugar diacid utilization regulator